MSDWGSDGIRIRLSPGDAAPKKEPPYTVVRSSAELSVDDERIEWPVTLARFSSGESLPAHGTSPRGKESVLAVLWDAGCYDIRLRATVAEEPGCRGAGCSDGSCQRCQAVPTAEWLAWKSRAPVAPPTFEQLVAKVGPLEGTALAAPVAPPEDPRTQDEIDRPAEEVIREIRGTPGGLAALYTAAPPEVACKSPEWCGLHPLRRKQAVAAIRRKVGDLTDRLPGDAHARFRADLESAVNYLDALPAPSPGDAVPEPRWRVGRSVGRTIYRDGALVGVMDTRELADEVVAALVATPTVAGDAVAVRDALVEWLYGGDTMTVDEAEEFAGSLMTMFDVRLK